MEVGVGVCVGIGVSVRVRSGVGVRVGLRVSAVEEGGGREEEDSNVMPHAKKVGRRRMFVNLAASCSCVACEPTLEYIWPTYIASFCSVFNSQ